MKGSCGLGADVNSGDVFVGGVLYYMMVVVSDYPVCRFLVYFRLLLEVSRGLNWRSDMGSSENPENNDIVINEKKA